MIPARRWGLPGLALGLAAGALLALFGRWPAPLLGAVLLGGGAAVVLRLAGSDRLRPYAAAPALAALAAAALGAVATPATELLGGVAGVALLLWLVDDPDRPPGGLRRGAMIVLVPLFAVAIAWSAGSLLPPGAVPFGVAGGLLALVLVALAFVLGRPDLLDREPAEAS